MTLLGASLNFKVSHNEMDIHKITSFFIPQKDVIHAWNNKMVCK